jgi:hypothetical protein
VEIEMEGLLKNVEGFCARLNAGLAAVAVVLTILVAAELTVRIPDFYQQALDTETASQIANNTTGGF